MLDFLRVSDLMFDIFSMKAHLDDFDGLFGYFVLRWAHFRRGDPRALLRRRRHCLLLGHAALLRNVIGLKVAWRVLVVLNQSIVVVADVLALLRLDHLLGGLG